MLTKETNDNIEKAFSMFQKELARIRENGETKNYRSTQEIWEKIIK
jgi:hypothetical protein